MVRAIFLAITLLMTFNLNAQASANEPANALGLAPEENAFLKSHPIIRVANELDWPPFDYYEFDRPK